MGSSNLPSFSLSQSKDFEQKNKMAATLASLLAVASLATAKPQVGFGFPSSSTTSLEQRVPNTCTTLSGSTCIFPFVYNGATHFQCTYSDSPTPWCATAVDSNNEVVTNGWGDCAVSATSACQTESIEVPTCTTSSGPRPGQSCVFPFRHLGIVYNACTSVGQSAPWCSTSTTSAGTRIDGEYGFCPSTCPADTSSTATTTTTTTTQASTSCTPGTFTTVDCNTCVCNSIGQYVCSTLTCSGTASTTTPTTTTTTTTTTAAPSTCSVSSGPAAGQSCVFPFTYGGTTFSGCAEWVYGGEHQGKLWCSTKVDSTGTHVNGEGNYGFCSSTCTAVSLFDLIGNLLGDTSSTSTKRGSSTVVFGSSSSTSSRVVARRPF